MENKIIQAEVLTNEEISDNIMKMTLFADEVAETAKPGQFINVYPASDRLILPRPISICDADPKENTVTIVYAVVGEGTKEFAKTDYGDVLSISTPLGNGFDMEHCGDMHSAVLVGGGVGIAPMVFLAKELSKKGVRCIAAAGFRKDIFLMEELRNYDCRVIVTTEVPTESAFVGNVVDCLDINEVTGMHYFACGPRAMLEAVSNYVYKAEPEAMLQVSLEERMGCGYGVCVGCACDIKERDDSGAEIIVKKKVCKDGPVFNAKEVVW
ncbi:MAG: dihydroorotate dehydrogenase electron transfer subunit [Firmicutes bacterium]|nr:dihydroorotate dehydrogenase electron transfer subunit [Bacillota bacterium]